MEVWKKVSLFDEKLTPLTLPVRQQHQGPCFKSWLDLEPYALPASSIVIHDKYLLQKKELYESNLYPILNALLSDCKNHIEILIIGSFEKDYWTGDANEILSVIKNEWSQHQQTSHQLGVILNRSTRFKEHDRGIFTPYLLIQSGDSFNYFDRNGRWRTNGTTIQFLPLSNAANRNSAFGALTNLKLIRDNVREKGEIQAFAGFLDNKLLDSL